jgi:hypothetical protein
MDKHYKALRKLTRNDDPMSDDPDEEFKVWPTNVDRDTFRKVMQAGSPEDVRAQFGLKPGRTEIGKAIADAYIYFHEAISEWLPPAIVDLEVRVDALYAAVREHLRMVVIDLSDEDDAQMIFETLNARGTPLLASDLVKNFLFHRAQNEKDSLPALYESYWQAFDDKAWYWRGQVGRGHAKRTRIDLFLLNYLTMRSGEEIPVGHLYTRYRDHALSQEGMSARQHLDHLHQYASFYELLGDWKGSSRERLFFTRVASMDMTTAHPFLLELIGRRLMEKLEWRPILDDLESFLVRRMICQLSTRGYNRLFLELLRALREGDGAPGLRIRNFLMNSDSESSRWPSDDEFKAAWLETPVYRALRRERVRMILEALEMQLHSPKTETIKFEERLTIEHLLPREWEAHWPLPENVPPDEAERKRGQLVHTMGNLTLLTRKLNPSISNGSWTRKRAAIADHSVLLLNKKLQQEGAWDEEAIIGRGEQLFEIACLVWPASKG